MRWPCFARLLPPQCGGIQRRAVATPGLGQLTRAHRLRCGGWLITRAWSRPVQRPAAPASRDRFQAVRAALPAVALADRHCARAPLHQPAGNVSGTACSPVRIGNGHGCWRSGQSSEIALRQLCQWAGICLPPRPAAPDASSLKIRRPVYAPDNIGTCCRAPERSCQSRIPADICRRFRRAICHAASAG